MTVRQHDISLFSSHSTHVYYRCCSPTVYGSPGGHRSSPHVSKKKKTRQHFRRAF
jgi:hypothetical protein